MSPEERMEAIRKMRISINWLNGSFSIYPLWRRSAANFRGIDYIIPPNKMTSARTENRFINWFGFEKALITEHIEYEEGRAEKGDFTDSLQKGKH